MLDEAVALLRGLLLVFMDGLAAGLRCLARLVVCVLLAVTAALTVNPVSAAVGGPNEGTCIPALLAVHFL